MISYFANKKPIVTGIDIGSSKICCWIVKNENIIGIGQASSRGFFAGKITDLSALEDDINKVLIDAEKGAGMRINDAILTFNSSVFHARYLQVEIPILHKEITQSDINKIISQASEYDKSLYPIHIIPIEYMVDNQLSIKNPIGMVGKILLCNLHVISISINILESILSCLKKCNINVKDIISSGYSSGLACLVKDEQELGSTLIDIGSGGTSIASFIEKKLVFLDFIPIGGNHITKDIARCINTTIEYSERIKILYGASLPSQNDYKEMITVPVLGDTIPASIPRSLLINVIQARSEEIFFLIKQKIEKIEYRYPFIKNRIIITGGSSKILGIKEQASRILENSVRIARPIHSSLRIGEEFSSISGIFIYEKLNNKPLTEQYNNLLSIISSWLKKKI